MSLRKDRAPLSDTPTLSLAEAYLDLCKQHLTRGSFAELDLPRGHVRALLYSPVQRALGQFNLELVRRVDPYLRDEGRQRSSEGETMIGMKRLNHLQHCVVQVIQDHVPGDLIETGVWRGGASIFMRAVLFALGDTSRKVWVADSFEGLPKPDSTRYPQDAGDALWRWSSLAVSLEDVKENFARYGLLDEQVRFLPGWFSDTLPSAPIERLSVLRLDGDMYQSTREALDALYPKLSVGGYVIIDDYGAIAACREAVRDFRTENAIEEEIHAIDWTGAYWRRA